MVKVGLAATAPQANPALFRVFRARDEAVLAWFIFTVVCSNGSKEPAKCVACPIASYRGLILGKPWPAIGLIQGRVVKSL
jgi:hypothetical protein